MASLKRARNIDATCTCRYIVEKKIFPKFINGGTVVGRSPFTFEASSYPGFIWLPALP